MSLRRCRAGYGRENRAMGFSRLTRREAFQGTVPGNRRQKTRAPGFSIPPARQRRKLTCLLSSVFCPLELSSVLSKICLLKPLALPGGI
ncbi:MAG: hypothetical protein LBD06_06650 [Candidatus Accumulibacter sp.]|nr:hypothetical protein [Accumulibacter sp.]